MARVKKVRRLRVRRQYLDYEDCFITLFHDYEKCMVVFLTDNGHTKAICYDDNFFYVESILDTYVEMLEKSFVGWKNRPLTEDDYDEMREMTKRFYRHFKRQCGKGTYYDIDNCQPFTREVLGE